MAFMCFFIGVFGSAALQTCHPWRDIPCRLPTFFPVFYSNSHNKQTPCTHIDDVPNVFLSVELVRNFGIPTLKLAHIKWHLNHVYLYNSVHVVIFRRTHFVFSTTCWLLQHMPNCLTFFFKFSLARLILLMKVPKINSKWIGFWFRCKWKVTCFAIGLFSSSSCSFEWMLTLI